MLLYHSGHDAADEGKLTCAWPRPARKWLFEDAAQAFLLAKLERIRSELLQASSSQLSRGVCGWQESFLHSFNSEGLSFFFSSFLLSR